MGRDPERNRFGVLVNSDHHKTYTDLEIAADALYKPKPALRVAPRHGRPFCSCILKNTQLMVLLCELFRQQKMKALFGGVSFDF
jgi:hypothetical protein